MIQNVLLLQRGNLALKRILINYVLLHLREIFLLSLVSGSIILNIVHLIPIVLYWTIKTKDTYLIRPDPLLPMASVFEKFTFT